MRVLNHITLPNRKLKINRVTTINCTNHFLERANQRLLSPTIVARTLFDGKVIAVKNGLLHVKLLNTNLIVRPYPWGYLLITGYGE